MSQSSSTSDTGDINFTDPNAGKFDWVLWVVGGMVVLLLIAVIAKKDK
jgi:hypothetical protein